MSAVASATRVARKAYRCDHCNRSIPKGSRYVYERLTPWGHPDNESFGHFRSHPRCEAFWKAEGWDWYGDGLLWDSPVEFRIACWRFHVREARRLRAGVIGGGNG